jgi:hypothetical protein
VTRCRPPQTHLHHPNITTRQAYFLFQCGYGQLPSKLAAAGVEAVKLPDGIFFMPTKGRKVFRALDIEPHLSEEARKVFWMWQAGQVDLPEHKEMQNPPPLSGIRVSSSVPSGAPAAH